MGDEEKKEAPKNAFGTVDRIFDRFSSYLSDRISTFVAFMFILITIGMFYGFVIIPKYAHLTIYLLATPLALALVSYYNRAFASILFVVLMIFVFIF